MSLRNFHILFITISVLLCVLFAGWSLQEWQEGKGALYLAQTVLAFAAGLGLVVYGRWFLSKGRRMNQ